MNTGHVIVLVCIFLFFLYSLSKKERYTETFTKDLTVNWTNGSDVELYNISKWQIYVTDSKGTIYGGTITKTTGNEDYFKNNKPVEAVISNVSHTYGDNTFTVEVNYTSGSQTFKNLYKTFDVTYTHNLNYTDIDPTNIVTRDCEITSSISYTRGADNDDGDSTGYTTKTYSTNDLSGYGSVCGDIPSAEITYDCVSTAWTNSGSCLSDGKQKQTRTVTKNYENATCGSNTRTIDCCYYSAWTNSGSCKSNGTQTQVKTMTGSVCPSDQPTKEVDCCYKSAWKPGSWSACAADGTRTRSLTRDISNCPANTPTTSTETENCCYESGWTNSGTCSSKGEQIQKQTIANCPSGTLTERTVDCCYKSAWTEGTWGACDTSGIKSRTDTRTVVNCDSSPSNANTKVETTDCCVTGEWGDWPETWSACSEQGKQTRTRNRTNVGSCDDIPSSETQTQDCCYTSPWTNSGSCSAQGRQTQIRTTVNCPSSTPTSREVDCCYTSPWSLPVWGDCGTDGLKRQTKTRTTVNCPSDTPTVETTAQEVCCYQGPWLGSSCSSAGHTTNRRWVAGCGTGTGWEYTYPPCCWQSEWSDPGWGACQSDYHKYKTRTRTVAGNCSGADAVTSIDEKAQCCYNSATTYYRKQQGTTPLTIFSGYNTDVNVSNGNITSDYNQSYMTAHCLAGCEKRCNDLANCKGFVWQTSSGKNPDGGYPYKCWLKSGQGGWSVSGSYHSYWKPNSGM